MTVVAVMPPATPPSTAVSVRLRERWMLLALLPGAALHAWTGGPMIVCALLAVIVLTGLFAATDCGHDRSRFPDRWIRASLMSMLGVLCLPPLSQWWVYAIATVATLSVIRTFDGRTGRSPFHPAMIGCATALVLSPGAPSFTIDQSASLWIAGAYFVGGVALAIGRCIRWQAPLAVFVGGSATSFAWQAIAPNPLANDIEYAAIPVFLLAGFFVATDPSSGCVSPRARWVQAAAIGILSELSLFSFHAGIRVFIGMAGAVLLMNAAAPWLDRRFERPPATRHAGTSGP